MKRTITIFLLLAIVAAFFASCGRKSVGTSEHTSEFSDAPDTSDTYDDEERNETKKPIDNSMFSENLDEIIDLFERDPSDSSLKGLSEGLIFELCEDGESYKLIDYENTLGVVIVPSTYNGKPVVSIGKNAFSSMYTSVNLVLISEGIKTIESRAFNCCEDLISVVLPSTLENFEDEAFRLCDHLLEVYNLSDLGIELSDMGPNVKNLYYDMEQSIGVIFAGDYVFYYDPVDDHYYLMEYYGSDASLVLPDNINGRSYDIFTNAFLGNQLTSLTVSNGVNRIGEYAFSSCFHLAEVIISDSVVRIDDYAFAYCEWLRKITIGAKVTKIGEDAFEKCNSLVEIYNRSSLPIVSGSESYGMVAYYACALYKDPSNRFYTQGDFKFFYDDIEDVYILMEYSGNDVDLILPSNINGRGYEIADRLLYRREDIVSISALGGVEGVGREAFAFCVNLRAVDLGNEVTFIGPSAFLACSSLESIDIGDLVESIGKTAFADCKALKEFYIPKALKFMGMAAFSRCESLETLHLVSVEHWLSVNFEDDRAYVGSEEIIISNGKPVILTPLTHVYVNGQPVITVEIPSTVDKIEDGMFTNFVDLETVVLNKSGSLCIEREAFKDCNKLTGVYYKGTKSEFLDTVASDLPIRMNIYYHSETEPTVAGTFWHYVDGVPTPW